MARITAERDTGRALWTGRGVRAVFVAVLLALGMLAGGWALAPTALLTALSVAAAVATAVHVVALRDGTRGELMYTTGQRVPGWVARLEYRSVVAEAIGAAALMIGLLATRPTLAVVGALPFVVLAWLARLSWQTSRMYAALTAIHLGRADRAERILRRLLPRVPGARHLLAMAVQRRDLDSALAEYEALWDGAIDWGAVSVALARLHAGDPGLAGRIAALPATGLLERHYQAQVVGTLALLGDGPYRVPPDLAPQLPPAFQKELALIDAANLYKAGDRAGALAALDGIDLDAEAWRARVQPAVWRFVDAARTGTAPAPFVPRRPVAAAPVAGEVPSVFAAPEADVPPAEASVAPRVDASALPVEWVALGPRRLATWRRVLSAASTVVFAVAILPVIPLTMVLVSTSGASVSLLWLVVAVVLVGLPGIGLTVWREAIEWFARRGTEGMRLADDSLFTARSVWVWLVWGGGPMAAAIPLFAAMGLVEPALLGTGYTTAGLGVLVMLVGVGVSVRVRAVVAAWAAHHAEGDTLLRAAARAPYEAAGWAVVCRVVAGDLAAAEQVSAGGLANAGLVDELVGWIRAGRGQVDLDRLLHRPTPAHTGSRFRHEVTVRLAALALGRPDRVADRVDGSLADWLPNRFGGLLHRLDHAVLAAVDPARAEAYAATWAVGLARGAWAEATWPDLLGAAAR